MISLPSIGPAPSSHPSGELIRPPVIRAMMVAQKAFRAADAALDAALEAVAVARKSGPPPPPIGHGMGGQGAKR